MHLIQQIVILTCLSIASSDLPSSFSSFNAFGKFRPSPNLDSSSSGTYEYTQYNPNDFILSLKTPNRFYGPPDGGPPELPPSHHHHYPHPPQDFYNAPNPNVPIYQKPQSYYHIQDLKPPHFQKPLFTPAGGEEFPASQGQVENFNRALQDEAQQQQLKNQNEPQNTAFSNGFTGYSNLGSALQPAKSYVNVKLGPQNLQYQYQI